MIDARSLPTGVANLLKVPALDEEPVVFAA
jgi:hypothetical protein